MSRIEGKFLQKGMNWRPRGKTSIFLMSRRPGAPYPDQLADEGRSLVYHGHDDHRVPGGPDPRTFNQPLVKSNGQPSDNAKFLAAAKGAQHGASPERVRVWEKLQTGIWVFNGEFDLLDGWEETEGGRKVFKFRLRLVDAEPSSSRPLATTRLIPSAVKAEVWKRDAGRCVLCGSETNLHFDHELPYSRGGTSLLANNIRILCAQHNLAKGDRIE